MCRFVIVLFFLVFKLCAAMSDEDYRLLPPMYEMDDYNTCNRETNAYCKIKLVLMPNDESNKLWQVIEATKKEKWYMDHDVMYRARCIPKEYFVDIESAHAYITKMENRDLNNISLHAKVEDVRCKKDVQELSVKNHFVLWLLASYLLLIAFTTIFDILTRRTPTVDTRIRKLVAMLSVLSSWNALRNPTRSTNYNKLKSFQGIRILIIFLVAGGHSIFAAATGFSSNVRLLEEYSLITLIRILTNFGLHMIQPCFLMSGWLHTIQVYNAVERSFDKKLTLNMISKALVRRYLRFVLPLMIYAGLQSTHLLQISLSGPQTDLLDADVEACRTYWWANLLLINNFFYVNDTCNLASWYLSSDFQAHVVCMALFYLSYKYRFGIKLFALALVSVIMVNAGVLYEAYTLKGVEIQVTYRIKAEDFKLENYEKNHLLFIFHTSPLTNLSSYLVGILFGALYYRYRNTKIEVNKVLTALWVLGYFGLPALVITLSFYNYSLLTSAIIGSLLKPLFAVGIAIGVLGMSHNIGGFVKRFFESRPLEFVSRWIFSVYLFHLPIVFYRSSTWTYMPELSYLFFVQMMITDTFLALALGLVIHLVFEKPLLNVLRAVLTERPSKPKTKTK